MCQRAHPLFEKAVAYGSYEGALRDLIHLLKYAQVRPAAAVLGRMLGDAILGIAASLPEKLVVVPVPLHERKQRQRGFNQSELIARAAMKCVNPTGRFEIVTGALQRIRETGSQIGLTRHQRRENLRGAFAVKVPGRLADRDVLLVDDVFTTGTTASECARVLRKAGVRNIWVATVARTLKVTSIFAVLEENREEGAEPHLAVAANG